MVEKATKTNLTSTKEKIYMEKIFIKNKKNQSVFDAIIEFRPTLNFSMLKTVLRKKDIRVNGKKIDQNKAIFDGDVVEVFLPSKKQKEIPILFEDKNVVIANKPAGIEVTKADKTFLDSDCLEEILNATACHRLDKNTEGIVVLAKNKTAEDAIVEAFKNQKIKKTYTAIVFGNVNKNGEKLENFLKKEQNFVKICKKNEKNAKIAKLSYVVKNQKDKLFELTINLETGRTHQIRVQLSGKKIFVLGDEKYGQKEINKKYHKKKQMLCASKIVFENTSNPLEYLSGKTFEIKPTFCLDDFE